MHLDAPSGNEEAGSIALKFDIAEEKDSYKNSRKR
jgi:hypothetical protein